MRKDCVYKGKCYSHGSRLNLSDENMICSDGTWEKSSEEPKSGLTMAPGEDLSDI